MQNSGFKRLMEWRFTDWRVHREWCYQCAAICRGAEDCKGSAIDDFGSWAKESEEHSSGLYKLCIAPMVDE